ncbi:MAG: hypothetical protein ABI171_14815 [Collimonas sp.]|uniref:hypothetical protein n=1 Tax=Collimonas sp. TaxID=1963772 RepID=UPI0032641A30
MSATASNLSAAAYGYDMICAVTEDGINVTMLELLAKQNQEFSTCWAVDEQGNTVIVPLQQIKDAIGVDPFTIPDGSDWKDPVMGKLNDAGFLYAFKAKLGLPAGVPLSQVPDVIKLNKGNSQVTYQLFCAEFSVIVLNYKPRNQNTFTNATQLPGTPWLFNFIVNMDLNPADDTPYSKLPPAAQARIKNVDPDTMFSVQQLLLDVSTRALEGAVTIPGMDPASPAYIALTEVFIGAYWDQMAPANSVLVGYSVAPAKSGVAPSSPSIVPTDLNFEIDPYRDASGGATIEGLNTLNYLVMANNSPMPPATPFNWNWLDPADESSYHGVMAVRRDIFAAFMGSLISPCSAPLSIDTTISMSHSFESFSTDMFFGPSPTPAQWAVTAAGTSAGADGYTPILTISYDHPSYDDATTTLHDGHINGDFNYTLTGDVSVNADQIRLTINTSAYCDFEYHWIDIPTANFSGNIVNLTVVAHYTMTTTNDGTMAVTTSVNDPLVTDTSQDIDVSTWDSFIGLDDTSDMIRDIKTQMTTALTSSISNIEGQVDALLNGSGGWIYPGGKTFFFKDIAFSNFQDLVSRVTYVDPNSSTKAVIDCGASERKEHLAKRAAAVEAGVAEPIFKVA